MHRTRRLQESTDRKPDSLGSHFFCPGSLPDTRVTAARARFDRSLESFAQFAHRVTQAAPTVDAQSIGGDVGSSTGLNQQEQVSIRATGVN
jgi:hypothetical protein